MDLDIIVNPKVNDDGLSVIQVSPTSATVCTHPSDHAPQSLKQLLVRP